MTTPALFEIRPACIMRPFYADQITYHRASLSRGTGDPAWHAREIDRLTAALAAPVCDACGQEHPQPGGTNHG